MARITVTTNTVQGGGFPNNPAMNFGVYIYPQSQWSIPANNHITSIRYEVSYNTISNTASGLYAYFSWNQQSPGDPIVLPVTNNQKVTESVQVPDNLIPEYSDIADEYGSNCSIRMRLMPRPANNNTLTSYQKYVYGIQMVVEYAPDATQSTATVDTVDVGQPQIIVINQPVPNLFHNVVWKYGNTEKEIETTDYSISVQPTNQDLNDIASYGTNIETTIFQGEVTVTTYFDSTKQQQIGTPQKTTCYMQLPQSIGQPQLTVTAVHQWTTQNQSIKQLTPPVQNFSKYTITPTVTPKYGASYDVSVNTTDGPGVKQGNQWIVNVLSGSVFVINVSVTDSRGFQNSYTETYNVTPCALPSIVEIDLHRCLSGQDTDPDDEGTYAYIQTKCSKNNLQDNDEVTVTVSAGNINATYAITNFTDGIGTGSLVFGNGGFNKELSYPVIVTVTDDYGIYSTYNYILPQATYTIYRSAGGQGVSFGKICEKSGVEINPEWNFYTHGEEIASLIMNISHPIGTTIEQINKGFNPNEYFGNTLWGLIETRVSNGNTYYIWIRSR